MSRNRGHVFVRAISAICVTALVLAACGGSDSSSNRNGRLNSTLCFDTQEEKDAAIADAQRALDEANTPTLEEASPSNNGGRATLAFVGPQLWWVRSASGGSTTTTTQPATTSSTSTSTSTSTTTSTTVASLTDSTDMSTDSTDVSTNSTDVSTDSTDVSTESSVPLVGEIPLQQLEDELAAFRDAPLCSELDNEEASDTTVSESESVECNVKAGFDLNNGTAYVEPCAEATVVRFTFQSPETTPETTEIVDVLVDSGSRATVANANVGVGFSFEVLVGSELVVDGFVDYPTDPPLVVTDVECPVQVALTPSAEGWLVHAETCDAATHWDLSYVNESGRRYSPSRHTPNGTGSFGMNYHFPVLSVGFAIYVGETLIAQGDLAANVNDNEVFNGSGTYQVTSFGDTETSYSGSFVPEQNTNEELEITEDEVLCSATVDNGSLSFSCSQPLYSMFAYLTSDGIAGNEGTRMSYGDESTVYDLSNNVYEPRIFIYHGRSYELVLLQDIAADGNATYEFMVPIVEESPETEFLDEGEGEDSPLFSGTINPRIGENLVSFTIPVDYSSNDFFIQLYVECGEQTGGAVLLKDGQEVAAFVDMGPYRVLNEGLCGVWLIVDDFSGDPPLGETFDVLITASTETRIMWDASVPLFGVGVVRTNYTEEEDTDIVWEETISGEITADAIYSISVPVGGRHFEANGITNVFDDVTFEEPFVDPMLILYDANGYIVTEDDDGGEDFGYGALSSRLRLFLPEGNYTLRATTYDIYYPDEASEFALSRYDLMFRIQAASVDTIKNEGTNEIVDEVVPSSDLPDELAVQVEKLDQAPANLEPPLQPVALPIEQLVNASRKDSDPLPVIPAGVTEVVCSSECLSKLREAAGVDEGVVTIQIGGEAVEIQPSARKATIPVRYSAKNIVVTVTPTDGGQPVVLSTETLVISPRTFPTKFVDGAKSVMKSESSNGGIPTNLFVVLTVLALSIAIGLIRRQKVRLPE